MKKKSTIFAIVAILCFLAALYFMYKETKDSAADFDQEADQDTDPEPEKKPAKNKKKTETLAPETNGQEQATITG